MFITNLFKKKKEKNEDIWNRFIDEICYANIEEETIKLNPTQQKAVLCFWYQTEMESGGHSGYFDCYPETNQQELYEALLEISNKDIANNYQKALKNGEDDDYNETDNNYYSFNPSLFDYLLKYVIKNKEDIFK